MLLLLVLFASQSWIQSTTAALSYGNITYGQTVTYGNNTYAETYLTPVAEGTTWYWSQAITPAILGTVYVVINDHNQTQTITSTDRAAVANNTQYMVNGSLSLLTRTDVDERGTVTVKLPSAGDREIVVAYPTPYFTVVRPIEWQGLFPSQEDGATCCNPVMTTASPVPQNHYSFPSLTGSTNTEDPRGWLYTIAESPLAPFVGSKNVSSLFAPATITSVRQHCPYPQCRAVSSALGAEGVRMAGALLETTTVRVTGTFSTSAVPAATAKPSRETSKTSPAEESGGVSGTVADTSEPATLGAIGVQVATGLLTVDSNLNIISPTTASPHEASQAVEAVPGSSHESSQAVEAVPEPAHQSSQAVEAVPDTLPTTSAQEIEPEVQTPTHPTPSPVVVAVGSTNLAVQATVLATTISGISTNIPAVLLGSHTIPIGASRSVGSIPVAVITAGDETAVVVDGSSTHILPPTTTAQEENRVPPPIVVGSSTISANSHTEYVVAGQTLAPGSSITVGDTPIALQTAGTRGTVLVIGTSSSVLQPQSTVALPPIVIGSSTITANSESQYIVAGQTLSPGSSITVGNTPIALQTDGPEGNVLVVGTSSSLLQHPPEPSADVPPIVIGSSTITANSASEYIVAGQTLQPGSSITIGSGSSTSVIALQTHGSETVLVVGSSSSILQPEQQQQQPTAVITIGDARITPTASSEYVIGSQTLTPGASAVTVSGVKYSLAPDGGRIVAGSSTKVLTSEADEMGGYIWSALGGGSEGGSSSSVSGRAARTTTSSVSSIPSGTSPRANNPTETDPSGGGAAERSLPLRWGSLVVVALVVFWMVGG